MADANAPENPPPLKEVPLEFVGKDSGAAGDIRPGTTPPPKRELNPTVRFALSILIGIVADALEAPLAGIAPAWILIDALAASAFFALWGFRWEVAIVLIPELIPGLNVFPTWFLLALYLGQQKGTSPKDPTP